MAAPHSRHDARVILPCPRVLAVPANFVVIRDGILVRTVLGREAADRPNEQMSFVNCERDKLDVRDLAGS